jgi:hypothetical protein
LVCVLAAGLEAECTVDAGAEGACTASACGDTTLDGTEAVSGFATSGSECNGFDGAVAACGASARCGFALDDANVAAGRVSGFAILESECGDGRSAPDGADAAARRVFGLATSDFGCAVFRDAESACGYSACGAGLALDAAEPPAAGFACVFATAGSVVAACDSECDGAVEADVVCGASDFCAALTPDEAATADAWGAFATPDSERDGCRDSGAGCGCSTRGGVTAGVAVAEDAERFALSAWVVDGGMGAITCSGCVLSS